MTGVQTCALPIYASVSHKLKNGTVFYPDQRMSRVEALKSYTVNNAYAAFEEKLKGSLEAGWKSLFP